MQDDRYPFGVLTIPWYLGGGVLALWALAPQYVYHLSFTAVRHGWGRGNVGPQDFAGYLGFGFTGGYVILALIVLAVTHRRTFQLALPARRDVLLPFLASTLVLAIPYVAVGVFYDRYASLPYDGDWAAISGFCTVGFAHFVLMTALAKRSRRDEGPAGEAAAR
jgi:hypothetical protein